MKNIALPNSCEKLENWKSRIRVNLHFFVSVGSSLSLHCTVKREEIAYSLYDPLFGMVVVHCWCRFSHFGCFGLFSKEVTKKDSAVTICIFGVKRYISFGHFIS